MTKKMKKVLAASALVLSVGASAALVGCVTPNKPGPDDKDPHVCEHVCDECQKCTDLTCTDPVCSDKCEGHTPDVDPDPKPVEGKLSLTSTVKATIGSSAAEATEIELDGVEAGDYTITVNGGLLLGQATVTVVIGETPVELTNNNDGTHSGKITVANETSIKVYTNAGNDVEDVIISLAEYKAPDVDPEPDPEPTELKAGANEVTIPESGELKCVLKIASGDYIIAVTPADGATLEFTYGEAIPVGEKVELDANLEILVKGTAGETVTITLTKQIRTLEAPTVQIVEGVLTWDSIDNASGYDVYEDGEFAMTVFEASYAGLSTVPGTHKYKVMAKGDGVDYADSEYSNEVEWDVEEVYDLTVGEEATVEIPADFSGIKKTVYLEAGEYTVKLSGEGADSCYVKDSGNAINGGTAFILPGSTEALITVATKGAYTLTFTNFSGATVTVKIETGDTRTPVTPPPVEEDDGTLSVDVAKNIKLNGSWGQKEYTFTADKVGLYKVELTNVEGGDPFVKLGNDMPVVESGRTSGSFKYETANEPLTICFVGDFNPITFTITITFEGDIVVKETEFTMSVPGMYGTATVKTLNYLEEGQAYVLTVKQCTQNLGRNAIYITYDGVQHTIDMSHMTFTFVATASKDLTFTSNALSGDNWANATCEIGEALSVNGTAEVAVAGNDVNVYVAGLQVGNVYTVTLPWSPALSRSVVTLKYNGTSTQFTQNLEEGVFEASFTAAKDMDNSMGQLVSMITINCSSFDSSWGTLNVTLKGQAATTVTKTYEITLTSDSPEFEIDLSTAGLPAGKYIAALSGANTSTKYQIYADSTLLTGIGGANGMTNQITIPAGASKLIFKTSSGSVATGTTYTITLTLTSAD